ncbi:ROK family protein [Mucilaginibacter psychrotolerans]|uniref:ROK family protein n=1 Tax=Mucilaginibacter psychrotolerans TaxID=1524096 RepID=A0A4Y8SKB5_9SPHI|nr:ROK family protein [Mucilaginibacter psychrotolerans]TFF39318.1 ROK family protein [Mucilaginibacter psychrotolerans]
MAEIKIIGIDLGATNVRGAVVENGRVSVIQALQINSEGTVEEVLISIYEVIDRLLTYGGVMAIGIGVPSIVDVDEGIVYNVLNIPSWKEVHLKKTLQERYDLPVYVNNDANCFAVGEYYYGKGKGCSSMIGLTMGTGLGAGAIINRHLYAGANCGAGEFGFIPYEHNLLEYHASGSFFTITKGVNGQQAFEDAQKGDSAALKLYQEFGKHVGYAIKMVMYTYDPQLIVLGGSARHGFEFFKATMWEEINTFAFPGSVQKIRIEVSELQNSGIVGAAALYLDSLA